jgi:hypothetical protein
MDITDFFITFDEIKEGDVLYELGEQKEVRIKHIFPNDKYAIICGDNLYHTYMKDGRRYDSDNHPRLLKKNPFQQKEKEEENKDINNIML